MAVRLAVALWLIQIAAAPVGYAASTIIVLGDSLSSGYGLGSAPSWVTILEDQLEREAYEYDIVNASIAGDTSTGGLNRLPQLLERYAPAIVVVELGGNDGLRGQPVSLLRDNLSAMIDLIARHGAETLLTGIQIPPNLGPAYTAQFAAVYRQLAEEHDVAFVDFLMDGVALDPSRMQPDRIHPNAAGQRPMFENVWAVLSTMID